MQSLLDWVSQHHGWAGLIVFLFAMGESLAVVGVMVPGVGVMLGVGALIGVGALPFWPILWWAVAGAIAGDGFSFWLGYHYKNQLRRFWPFSRYPKLLAQGESFFQKHGGKSVFLGRFFGPVRAIIPTTAGMMQMSPWRFNLINITSALLWAPIYLGVGMAIGTSLSLAAEVATRLAVLAITLGISLWLGLWLLLRLYRFLAPRAVALSDRLLHWGQRHPRLGQFTAALVDPQRAELKGLIVIALLLISLAWLVIALFTQFSLSPPLARLDSSVYHLLQGLRTPWGDQVMIVVSQLGDGRMHIALLAGLGLWLIWKRYWFAAAHWTAAVSFGAIAAWVLKQSLQLPRPNPMFEGSMAYSFPSAHTLLAVCSFGFLAILIAREAAQRWRWLVYATAWGFILLIAFSRLYLGAHWLSDVVGGLVIGLIWIIILGVAFRRHASPAIPLSGLIAVPAALLLGVGGWHVTTTYDTNFSRYAPRYEVNQMSATQWQETGWRTLPDRRIDTRGVEMQPFNLQWAGSLNRLEQTLRQQGWQTPPPLTLRSALSWLRPDASLADQPLLPQAHDGRHQAWQMIAADQGLLIRLWHADVLLAGMTRTSATTPLWLGYIGEVHPMSLPLLSVPRVGDDFDQPITQLLPQLPATIHAALRTRPASALPDQQQWQGEVLLMWPAAPAGPRADQN